MQRQTQERKRSSSTLCTKEFRHNKEKKKKVNMQGRRTVLWEEMWCDMRGRGSRLKETENSSGWCGHFWALCPYASCMEGPVQSPSSTQDFMAEDALRGRTAGWAAPEHRQLLCFGKQSLQMFSFSLAATQGLCRSWHPCPAAAWTKHPASSQPLQESSGKGALEEQKGKPVNKVTWLTSI